MKKFIFCLTLVSAVFMFCINGSADIATEMDTVIVTATRIAQHNYKIAGNVTVLTKEQIEASHAQSIPEILKEAVGAFIYDKNTTKTATLDIRGFGDTATRNVLVLVNGRKINAVDLSGPDLLQIPVEAVERIEIIRGAGSVLYGDNAVGGVVNILTRKGEGGLSGRTGGSYGSYDAQGTDTEISGAYKNISYFLYGKYADQRGYRQNSDVLTKDFNGRLGYKFSEKLSVDVDFGWHEDTYDLPGGLNPTELAATSRRDSANPADVADTEDRFVKLSLDVTPWLKDPYVGEFVVDLHARQRDVFDSFSGYDTDRSIRTLGVTGRYIFDHMVFDHEVNFVTGIDYYDTENDILGSGSNSDDLTISKGEFGAYGFLQAELFPNFFASGGTRYQKADYAFSQRNVAVDEKKHPSEWVSMGGFKYEFGEGSTLHASVQQTFRFLATDEWYSSFAGLNTDLEQQTGIQYEAGIKHNFNNVALASLTPYYMIIDNEIFFDPTNGFFGSNSNYDKTRRYGFELDGKVDLNHFMKLDFLDKWELFSNYTYQNPRFDEGANDGKDIPMVPRHQATAGTTVKFLDYFNFSLIGKYTGSRFAINDTLNETSPAKPYYVLDARLAYERDSLEFYVNINNILNELYAPYLVKSTSSTTKDAYPAPETNFVVGVNLKF